MVALFHVLTIGCLVAIWKSAGAANSGAAVFFAILAMGFSCGALAVVQRRF